MITVHAPQRPAPHPNLTPTRFFSSRNAQRSGVSGGLAIEVGWLLRVKSTLMRHSPVDTTACPDGHAACFHTGRSARQHCQAQTGFTKVSQTSVRPL